MNPKIIGLRNGTPKDVQQSSLFKKNKKLLYQFGSDRTFFDTRQSYQWTQSSFFPKIILNPIQIICKWALQEAIDPAADRIIRRYEHRAGRLLQEGLGPF